MAALPLLILLPLSATIMVLPIGRRFTLHRETTPITVSQALAIARDSVDPPGGRAVEFARMVHEGERGGPWSGLLNMAGALGLLAVMSAGMISWSRRRGARRVDVASGGVEKAA